MIRSRYLFSFAVIACFLSIPFGVGIAQETPNKKTTKDKLEFKTGLIQSHTYDFKEAGTEMEYALFVPKGYDKSKAYPLIVALHGLGATPQIMLRYPGLTSLAQKHGYIVVAPMGYNSKGWYGSRGQQSPRSKPKNLGELSEKDVMNVLELMKKNFKIDENRLYLMGHSMGGGGTWHLGLKYPKLWTALAPIAPAIFRSPKDLNKIKHIPVIVVQGEKDNLVKAERTRVWVDEMKKLGMVYQYIEVKGGNHITPAFQKLPDIFAFFNKHVKKVEGK